MEKEDGNDDDGRRGWAKQGAKGHGYGCDGSINNEKTAEAETAKGLDDECLHAQVAGEEREQVQA